MTEPIFIDLRIALLIQQEQIEAFVFQEGLYELLRDEALRLKLDEEPVYRDRLREFQEEIMAEKMRNNLIARNLVVTEDDVRKFYDSHIDSLKEPEQYHIREILVNTDAAARDLLKQAKAGADFEALAREHTVRPGFKTNAGDLGWVGPRRYGELYKTAAELDVGEVGGPVPGVNQYSVIKVLEKKPAPKGAGFDVDVCKECNGVWLDSSEIDRLEKKNFPSGEKRALVFGNLKELFFK